MNSILFILMLFLALSCRNRPNENRGAHDDELTTEIPYYETLPSQIGGSHELANIICNTDKTKIVTGPTLSPQYLNNCSGCHGSAGEGSSVAPSLQKLANKGTFVTTIRKGRGKMPAFATTKISDEDIDSDFELLRSQVTKIKKVSTQLVPLPTLEAISESEFQETMRKGLIAWRTPGNRGACASCHGPDGIDLARIAYPNGAMLRRALGQGLNPTLSMDIVNMIEAQRRHSNIADPCNPIEFRPLQPGMSVLNGATPAEKEQNLLDALNAKEVDIAGNDVTSYQLARNLADAIVELDVNSVPIAIPLNRWAEDEFHGAAHKSTAEWLPELPLEASSPENEKIWIDLQNNYLESYDIADLWKLIDGVKYLNSSRFSDGGVGERLAREKYKAVLTMQHMLRTKNMNIPDLQKSEKLNRFSVWETAQISSVMLRGCADAGTTLEPFPCWDYPGSFYKKMGTDPGFLITDLKKINLPWLIGGFMQDPALQLTEGGDAQLQHLLDAFNREAIDKAEKSGLKEDLFAHQIYISFVRLIKAKDALDLNFPTGELLDRAPVNGCWNTVDNSLEQWSQALLPNLKIRGLFENEEILDQNYQLKIQKIIHNANATILNLILNSLSNSNTECAQYGEHHSMEEIIDSIQAFEYEMNPNKALEFDEVIGKIKERLELLK